MGKRLSFPADSVKESVPCNLEEVVITKVFAKLLRISLNSSLDGIFVIVYIVIALFDYNLNEDILAVRNNVVLVALVDIIHVAVTRQNHQMLRVTRLPYFVNKFTWL